MISNPNILYKYYWRLAASALMFFVSSLYFPAPAFSNGSASFVITGTVPSLCSISINTSGSSTNDGYNITDLTVSGSQTPIANVRENCNNSNGYTVSLSSANSGTYLGKLYDSSSGNSLNYTIYYNGSPLSSTVITNANNAADTSKNLSISYSSNSSLAPSSSYSDTLNFTITAK
jgi:hypothetical protein